MGYALAAEATRRRAHVTLITGPVSLTLPCCHRIVRVVSALEMHKVALRCARGADVVIASAAVCDWRPFYRAKAKVKKPARSGAVWKIPFVLNPDILRDLSRLKTRRPRVMVGFALETHDLIRNAHAKLAAKNLDLIVANSAAAIGGRKSRVVLLDAKGKTARLGLADKKEVARTILDIVEGRRELR
jgi:phosphopantothenoylcysteine decarboxylase/phosphopantothenate--cysteine ligase